MKPVSFGNLEVQPHIATTALLGIALLLLSHVIPSPLLRASTSSSASPSANWFPLLNKTATVPRAPRVTLRLSVLTPTLEKSPLAAEAKCGFQAFRWLVKILV